MGQTGIDRLGYMVGYTFSRLGLLLSLICFGTFFGTVVLPCAAELLPGSMEGIGDIISGPVFTPAAVMAVICMGLIRVFREDGMGNTAYEDRSVAMIFAALMTVGMIYFIPALLRDHLGLTDAGELLFEVLYYTSAWLSGTGAVSFSAAVLISDMVMLGVSFAAYMVSYKRHIGRHFLVCVRDR